MRKQGDQTASPHIDAVPFACGRIIPRLAPGGLYAKVIAAPIQ